MKIFTDISNRFTLPYGKCDDIIVIISGNHKKGELHSELQRVWFSVVLSQIVIISSSSREVITFRRNKSKSVKNIGKAFSLLLKL